MPVGDCAAICELKRETGVRKYSRIAGKSESHGRSGTFYCGGRGERLSLLEGPQASPALRSGISCFKNK
jgi:hypothetical protein